MSYKFEKFIKFFVFTILIAAMPACTWFTTKKVEEAVPAVEEPVVEAPGNVFLIDKGDATDAANFEKYIKEFQFVLVDFFATWCPPCKKVLPILKDTAGEYAGKGLAVVFVDIDMARDLTTAQKVGGVPTFKYFKDGKYIENSVHMGFTDKDGFKKKLEEHFGI
jgi:thioredoxin 1